MSEWSEIKARFKRPLIALFLCLMLLNLSHDLFDAANRAYLPPDPATLHAIAVRVDKLAACPYTRTAGSRQNSGYRPLCYFSNDYPDAAFEAGAVVTGLVLPRTLELLTDREPNDLKNVYEGQMFSVHVPIRVYGLRQMDGKVLWDPVDSYDRAWSKKQRKKAYAWLVVLIALGCAAYVFVKIRAILRDPYL
ncbi:hypothetical protein [Achromobacter xylosoxidans]|uniref:hypothetical protein n=1 Tax=Alcaligenes xylosoxydans xylosoxydans TaxID=85698 RepID=UPI001F14411E|nr:hypothetical protein [Achromobacter xylosoxidans]